ncbi:hypothetical protein ACOMHN_050061 [Nucella lapillus]
MESSEGCGNQHGGSDVTSFSKGGERSAKPIPLRVRHGSAFRRDGQEESVRMEDLDKAGSSIDGSAPQTDLTSQWTLGQRS